MREIYKIRFLELWADILIIKALLSKFLERLHKDRLFTVVSILILVMNISASKLFCFSLIPTFYITSTVVAVFFMYETIRMIEKAEEEKLGGRFSELKSDALIVGKALVTLAKRTFPHFIFTSSLILLSLISTFLLPFVTKGILTLLMCSFIYEYIKYMSSDAQFFIN